MYKDAENIKEPHYAIIIDKSTLTVIYKCICIDSQTAHRCRHAMYYLMKEISDKLFLTRVMTVTEFKEIAEQNTRSLEEERNKLRGQIKRHRQKAKDELKDIINRQKMLENEIAKLKKQSVKFNDATLDVDLSEKEAANG